MYGHHPYSAFPFSSLAASASGNTVVLSARGAAGGHGTANLNAILRGLTAKDAADADGRAALGALRDVLARGDASAAGKANLNAILRGLTARGAANADGAAALTIVRVVVLSARGAANADGKASLSVVRDLIAKGAANGDGAAALSAIRSLLARGAADADGKAALDVLHIVALAAVGHAGGAGKANLNAILRGLAAKDGSDADGAASLSALRAMAAKDGASGSAAAALGVLRALIARGAGDADGKAILSIAIIVALSARGHAGGSGKADLNAILRGLVARGSADGDGKALLSAVRGLLARGAAGGDGAAVLRALEAFPWSIDFATSAVPVPDEESIAVVLDEAGAAVAAVDLRTIRLDDMPVMNLERPNEPSGFAPMMIPAMPWDIVPAYPGGDVDNLYWQGEHVAECSVVADASAPTSPSNVLAVHMPLHWGNETFYPGSAGTSTATINRQNFHDGGGQFYRRMYVCADMKFSANFVNNPVGMKCFFFVHPDEDFAGYSDLYTGWSGPNFSVGIFQQSYDTKNYYANTGDGSRNDAIGFLGQWQKYEWLIELDTGGSDGRIRCWVDNHIIMDYQNQNFGAFGPKDFRGIRFSNVYGGGPGDSNDQYQFIDHIYVSGSN